MCELLVRVVDKVNEKDQRLNAQLLKRGHVVSICDDGFVWSERCLKNPDWRIIKMPGVRKSEVQYLLAPHVAWVAVTDEVVTVSPRAIAIDFDDSSANPKIKDILRDQPNQGKVEVSKSDVESICKEKPESIAGKAAVDAFIERKRKEKVDKVEKLIPRLRP